MFPAIFRKRDNPRKSLGPVVHHTSDVRAGPNSARISRMKRLVAVSCVEQ